MGRWGGLDLPPLSGPARLGISGDRLVLLEVTDQGIQYQWKSEEGWAEPHLIPDLGPLIQIVQVDDQLMLVTESGVGQLAFNYLTPQGLASLGVWPQDQDQPWSVMGHRGRPVLVRVQESLEISEVDPLTGERAPWRVLTMGSPLTMSLWPVLVAFMASAIVLLVLVRTRLLALPEGVVPLAPIARLVALLIDAIPGFIVVFGFMEGNSRMFVDAITLSLEHEQWLIYAILVAITCLWSLSWELWLGSSPGKLLFGASLIGPEGDKPLWHRKLRRTLLKGVLLLLPILMITALRPPTLQSAADQGAGVIIVRRAGISTDSDDESKVETDETN